MKNKFFKMLSIAVLLVPMALALSGCGSPKDIGDSVGVFFHFNDYNAETKAKLTEEYKTTHNLSKDTTSIGFYQWDYENLVKDAPKPEDIIAPTFNIDGVKKEKVFGGWYYGDDTCPLGNNFNRESWNKLKSAESKHTSVSLYAKWLDKGKNIITFNLENEVMDYTTAFKETNDDNIKNRVLTFEFNDTDNFDTLKNKFPVKEDIYKENYDYIFDGWYLSPTQQITETELTVANLNKLKANDIHCFNAYAKWKRFPQVKLSYQAGYLPKYSSFFYKDGGALGLVKEITMKTSFNDAKKLNPTIFDMELSSENVKQGAIIDSDKTNVEITQFYLDEEFTEEFNETNFNEFIKSCEEGNGRTDINDYYHGYYYLKIYTKMDYVRKDLNIKFFANDVRATKNTNFTKDYLDSHKLENMNSVINLKDYSFTEIQKLLPTKEQIITPEFGSGKKEFIGFEISDDEKGILAYKIPLTKENWNNFLKDKSIKTVRITLLFDDVRPY